MKDTTQESFGLGSALAFLITISVVSWGAYTLASMFDFDDMASKGAALIGLIMYFAYVFATSNSDVVVKAKAEAIAASKKATALELEASALRSQLAELQSLANALQLTQVELQSVKAQLQSEKENARLAGQNLRNVSNRCVRLLQLARQYKQSLDKYKANAEADKATAKAIADNAQATAVANAENRLHLEYAPALEVANAYKEYALKMGITNSSAMKLAIGEGNVQLVKDERELAKKKLDAFVDLHKDAFAKDVEQRFGVSIKTA